MIKLSNNDKIQQENKSKRLGRVLCCSNYCQETQKQKTKANKHKSNRSLKAMGNITPTMYYYPRNR